MRTPPGSRMRRHQRRRAGRPTPSSSALAVVIVLLAAVAAGAGLWVVLGRDVMRTPAALVETLAEAAGAKVRMPEARAEARAESRAALTPEERAGRRKAAGAGRTGGGAHGCSARLPAEFTEEQDIKRLEIFDLQTDADRDAVIRRPGLVRRRKGGTAR